jgi:transcriptional regulator with XRE-family HTH domain
MDVGSVKLFGGLVRMKRLEQRMPPEKLAELSGLDPAYIAGIEVGERNPTLVDILKIARALCVPPSELLECYR